jgi:hypothetical protein
MQANIQYELFETNDDISLLQKEMSELRVSQNNLRKGLFARHNDLSKLYMRQQDELEKLKLKLSELIK